MPPIPKHQILLIRRNKLIPRMVHRGAALPQPRVPEPVEGGVVRVVGGVLVDFAGRDFDGYASRDVLPVGEMEALEHFALEGGPARRVEAHRFLHVAVEFDHLLERARGELAVVFGEDLADFGAERLDVLGALGGEVVQAADELGCGGNLLLLGGTYTFVAVSVVVWMAAKMRPSCVFA